MFQRYHCSSWVSPSQTNTTGWTAAASTKLAGMMQSLNILATQGTQTWQNLAFWMIPSGQTIHAWTKMIIHMSSCEFSMTYSYNIKLETLIWIAMPMITTDAFVYVYMHIFV
jgi:hypothetical protein